MILILEDDADRVRRFGSTVQRVAPGVELRFWRTSTEMMNDLVDVLEHAALISLDHDLNRFPGDLDDPGTGYDVIKLLAELEPCCPLIIHTSNGERGNWMIGELSRTRWAYVRVYPTDGDWIETVWASAVRTCLIR